MYCKYCGKDNPDDAIYCAHCGKKLETTVIDAQIVDDFGKNEVQSEPRCWAVFAKVGKIVGIVAIATFWIPYGLTFAFAIHGIVASALGKKSSDFEATQNANTGLVLNIVASVLSITSFIVWAMIIAALSI